MRMVSRVLGFTLSIALAGPLLAGPPELSRDIREEVFYHFMPIAFRDGNNDPQRFGDFQGMTDSLPYLSSLGVTAVWMNPIFVSPAYHGYQHGPADTVNPRFGTEADFLAFVDAAHQAGIRVFVDFVVYGISHESIWYQDAFGNPNSVFDDYLAFFNQQNTDFTGSQFSTWNGDTVGFIHWDLRTNDVFEMVTGWAEHWLDPNDDGDPSDGIDGYRFDHVWVNYCCGPDGWGYNRDTFWSDFFDRLRLVNPDVFVFAEQADWGSHGSEFVPPFDAAFTKPFEFAARSALALSDATSLYEQMAITTNLAPAPVNNQTFLTIIGDHDVDRLASSIGASTPGTIDRAKAAAAVLMFQPFTPIIYTGDEIAMIGTKQNYGSDANDIPFREPFKWTAVNSGTPMTNYHVLNAQAFNNSFSQNNDGRSVEEQDGIPGSILETYRAYIDARSSNVALQKGSYTPVFSDRDDVWAFLRHQEENGSPVQSLLVVINLSGQNVQPDLDLSAFGLPLQGSGAFDVLVNAERGPITDANAGAFPVSLGAFEASVMEVTLDPPTVDLSAVDGLQVNDAPLLLLGRSLQGSPTSVGDNINELNQMTVRLHDDGLLIGISGNLDLNGTALALLIDSEPGGQTTLDTSNLFPPPSGVNELTGTQLEGGFEADIMYFANAFGGTVFVDVVDLLDLGGGSKDFRGSNPVGSGQGLLSGGVNPNGLQFTLDNSNIDGVTDTDADDPGSATSGFEILVPWGDMGLPGPANQLVRLAAFITQSNGNVSNQWLPPVFSNVNLGLAPNLALEAGTQRMTVLVPIDCPGDANLDGAVDFSDITTILGFWLGDGPSGDANRDGGVDFGDISSVLGNWNQVCPGP